MDEEMQEDIDRDTGIEEGEADHRINEFRDLVRRLENIESGIKEGFARLAWHGRLHRRRQRGRAHGLADGQRARAGADGNGKSGCGRRFPGDVLGRPGRGFGYLRR